MRIMKKEIEIESEVYKIKIDVKMLKQKLETTVPNDKRKKIQQKKVHSHDMAI